MVTVSYDQNSVPPDAVLELGDQLRLLSYRRMPIAIWGTPERAAKQISDDVLAEFAAKGQRFRVDYSEADWLDDSAFSTDYLVRIVFIYEGPMPQTGERLMLAKNAIVIILSVTALLVAFGWTVHEWTEFFRVIKSGGKSVDDALDTLSLFPIAAVLLGAFFLLRKKA